MIPKYRAWNTETKEIEVFETYEEISELFLALSADDGFYSIMQSTGLFDKHGKEIFEGDIVKMAKDVYSEPTYYEIVRHRGGAYRLESNQHGCELWLRHTNCEVIGNIYENPELLEEEE
jgi:hypothetical protein|nr:MAG TPA: YopX protein [Caudoviricetes sp.]